MHPRMNARRFALFARSFDSRVVRRTWRGEHTVIRSAMRLLKSIKGVHMKRRSRG